MKEVDCEPKAPPTRGNTTDGTPKTDGAGINTNRSSTGTWRLLESNASRLPPNLECTSCDNRAYLFFASLASFAKCSSSLYNVNFFTNFFCLGPPPLRNGTNQPLT
jgi:hypothetical protein